MCQSFVLDGGSHDGERIDPPGVAPETLFAIALKDGATYARAGEQLRDPTGVVRELFRFDPDGTLTEQAKRAFAKLG
jgi:hypothetical protein